MAIHGEEMSISGYKDGIKLVRCPQSTTQRTATGTGKEKRVEIIEPAKAPYPQGDRTDRSGPTVRCADTWRINVEDGEITGVENPSAVPNHPPSGQQPAPKRTSRIKETSRPPCPQGRTTGVVLPCDIEYFEYR